MRGLYIHIPFCKNICYYCDFFKRIPKHEDQINSYVERLIEELDSYKKYLDKSIKTIYIGGGTPNLLNDLLLEKLFKAINSYNLDIVEYSIEINPDLLTLNQIKLFNKYNINRISIGAQNFNDEHLRQLGRKHNKLDIINAVKLLKENNISNINIDLIFGYPNDSISNIEYNLEEFFKLKIPHISYYNLILEEKTKFYIDYLNDKFKLNDQDLEASMYLYIQEKLIKNNYKHYEISNFTTNNESIHNKIYWDNLEYVAIGAGASGYLDKSRYTNNHKLDLYNKSFKEDYMDLSLNDIKNEFMMLGLRKIDGVSLVEYKNRYNADILDDFNLDKLFNNQLLEISNNYIKLTKKGIMLANIVFQEFV